MRPRLATVAALALALAIPACGPADAAPESSSAEDAIGTAPVDAPSRSFAAPQVQSGDRYWDTVILQNQAGFDGALMFGSQAPDGQPDRVFVLDRRSGAIGYLSQSPGDAQQAGDDLSSAGQALTLMAGDLGGGDIRFADFVTDENKCFLKFAGVAVLAVGAVVAAPFVAEWTAGAWVAGQTAIAGITEEGLAAFAAETAKAAWASTRFRWILGLKIADYVAEYWIFFSKQGQELTAPLRKQLGTVVHAQCLS